MKKSYYEILGVTKEATLPEIRSGYKAALLLSHPDKKFTSTAEAHLKHEVSVIKEAFTVLSDSEQRAAYDEELQNSVELDRKLELSGEALAVVTLDEFTEDEDEVWSKDCPRCTQNRGFELGVDHLESGMSYSNRNEEDGSYEIVIQCSSCSLWLKVKYFDLDE